MFLSLRHGGYWLREEGAKHVYGSQGGDDDQLEINNLKHNAVYIKLSMQYSSFRKYLMTQCKQL